MVSSLLSLVAVALVPSFVSAHGQLRKVTIGGTSYDAPDLYFDGSPRNGNTPVRKGYKADSPSYLLPGDFSNDNKMACQEAGAAPAVASANPGDTVVWSWEGATPELTNAGFPGDGQYSWVHAMGPIMTYIGSCNGDCKSVDASQIGWQKIDFKGLAPGGITDQLKNAMQNKPEPYQSQGSWALAELIESNSQYQSHIPQGLKSGQYMLRSELSAVHNPKNDNPTTGPQNYVACLQIEIKNGGNVELPYGTKAGSLYPTNGDLANYNVFNSPASFPEVGPAQWDGASGSSTSNQGNTQQNQGNDNSNNGQGNQGQSSGDNTNTGNTNQGGDNSNQGGDSSNQGGDNSNQGGDNSNQGGYNTGDSNNGQQNQDGGNSDSSTDATNANQGQNQDSGNSSSTPPSSGKTCRRRTKRSSVPKVARSLHMARAKRHH
ncbi:hypothetical protein E1B28_013221 [Marasmius oreades]|uniref:AA9 family lytic polysaccharide monooxygenase n=1 Tax=Marasmius oreades TaxID=181124 RepID=A0A9P7UNT2_9AGAR|nr:uncharacterized protein E1B28_013221 [Marasmius oreades]KAG7087241.1 hypothetical protein E1B28_013221 [Marasmius oreades]